jgi:uncharacterized phage-associated protein
MQEEFRFDREKFKDAVHFVIHHVGGNGGRDSLSTAKLHKTLYYSDILRFLDTGQPLTGEDYLRQRFGPTARHLAWAIQELEKEERVSVSRVNYFGYAKSEYEAAAALRSNRLANDEIALITHVIEFVCQHTAHEISEFSHDEVWSSVAMGERIPYYAAFAMLPAELTEDDIEDAENEAIRLAPRIEAAKRDRHIV